MKAKEKKVPTVFQASIPILSMLIILGVGIGGFGLPAEPLIVLSLIHI